MLSFSYQCPYRIVSFLRTILFVVCHFLADSLLIISHLFFFVKNFFKFFPNHFLWYCVVFRQRMICYHIFLHLSTTFFQLLISCFIESKSPDFFAIKNGEGGIWTLAPRKRSTPLAGAPLQPLEYFSICLNHKKYEIICYVFYNAWLFYQNKPDLSIDFPYFFFFFFTVFLHHFISTIYSRK